MANSLAVDIYWCMQGKIKLCMDIQITPGGPGVLMSVPLPLPTSTLSCDPLGGLWNPVLPYPFHCAYDAPVHYAYDTPFHYGYDAPFHYGMTP